ncbi:hypothetical protein FrCorBMG51_06405 [Protofrankia coriariae]|uniref:Uncharacterized protein n=1 Tax=Protofrankia coriariae TaxID=1562887 RepID=A0ABR5F6D9_9ACTN|nr:hypothetical protein FrCorBMG51_06405 [Protofrankia coriariae]
MIERTRAHQQMHRVITATAAIAASQPRVAVDGGCDARIPHQDEGLKVSGLRGPSQASARTAVTAATVPTTVGHPTGA